MTKPQAFSITIARPSSAEPTGRIERGWFVVENDTVKLTDAEGTPLRRSARGRETGGWERKLTDGGEDVWAVGHQLLWAKWRSTRGGGDFNRPLEPPPVSIA